MEDIEIRRATQNDISDLSRMLYQVQKVHSDVRPDLFKPGGKKYTNFDLCKILDDEKRPIFVAEWDGAVMGYAFCIHKEVKDSKCLSDIKTLYIDDLCVDEYGRGRHIGAALYNFVIDYARKKGYYNVTLNVWADNSNAVKFYEHMGLKPQKIGMEKIL